MDKEIADCLLRGDMPILPPESFAVPKETEPIDLSTSIEDEVAKKKRKQLKKRQYFRRQQLKKEKQLRLYTASSPAINFDPSPPISKFSRDRHDYYVQEMNKEKEHIKLDLEGKSEEELKEIDIRESMQLKDLEKENDQLHQAIYRMKKKLQTLATM